MPHTNLPYRPDIDGLRAIAVIAVLVFHFFPYCAPGGFVGVDVFFVISGFLITQILNTTTNRKEGNLSTFYARRIRRIFPSLLFVLIIVILVGWFCLWIVEFREVGQTVAWSTVFLENIFSSRHRADYFGPPINFNPLLHLWSLGVEEQFYLIWPLFLILCGTTRRRFRASIFVVFLSLSYCLFLTPKNASESFYSLPTRLWELAAGGTLALGHRQFSAPISHLFSAIGALLIAVPIFCYNGSVEFPGWRALFPVIGSCAILAAGSAAVINRFVLSNRSLVALGLISYPLYLWHYPLLDFANKVTDGNVTILLKIGLLLTALCLAWFCFRYIEKPIRSASSSSGMIRNLVLVNAALFFTGSWLAGFQMERLTLNGPMPRLNSPNNNLLVAATRDSTSLESLTSKASFDEKSQVMTGIIGADGADKFTLFVGDSNIEQYAPRVQALGASHKGSVLNSAKFFLRGGCTPISGTFRAPSVDCGAIIAEARNFSGQHRVTSVVFGARWNPYLDGHNMNSSLTIKDHGGHIHRLNSIEGKRLAMEALLEDMSWFKKKNINVYIIQGIPFSLFATLPLDPKQFIRPLDQFRLSFTTPVDFSSDKGGCSREVGVNEPIRTELAALALKVGAVVIDPIPTLCPQANCALMTKEGTVVYSNGGHLTATFVRKYADFIDKTLD